MDLGLNISDELQDLKENLEAYRYLLYIHIIEAYKYLVVAINMPYKYLILPCNSQKKWSSKYF